MSMETYTPIPFHPFWQRSKTHDQGHSSQSCDNRNRLSDLTENSQLNTEMRAHTHTHGARAMAGARYKFVHRAFVQLIDP